MAEGGNELSKEHSDLQRLYEQRRVRVRVPAKIGDVVNDLIARRGYLQTKGAKALREAWEQVAGEQLAARSQTGNIKRGVLEVFVQNSVVLQEFSFEKARLLKRLQALDCGRKIRDLRFRVG